MPFKIVTVDAFPSTLFGGNPAAVCVLPGPADPAWMQKVAREMNLAEASFLHPREVGYSLRWFTPVAEVDLCGHATLAAAHALWESGRLPSAERARFHTRSGDWIELDFPATPDEPAEAPPVLVKGLGASPRYVGKSRFDYLVELESEEQVRNLRPNFGCLKELPARGVIVTSRPATPERDFVSRFFAPALGIDEDPVTGSAHCCLGPYWSRSSSRRNSKRIRFRPGVAFSGCGWTERGCA
jgi:predicted PhzF superfamily epimerase YddE/YHI9